MVVYIYNISSHEHHLNEVNIRDLGIYTKIFLHNNCFKTKITLNAHIIINSSKLKNKDSIWFNLFTFYGSLCGFITLPSR